MQLFNNILPKGFKLHKDNFDDMYFINKGDDSYFSNESICHLIIHVDKKDNEINIIKLEIKPEYRGKGIGTFMMIMVSKLHKDMIIILDDMSKNSRKPNNIYIKLGLEYVNNNTTEPEMQGSCKVVGSKWEIFLDNYLYNGFFV